MSRMGCCLASVLAIPPAIRADEVQTPTRTWSNVRVVGLDGADLLLRGPTTQVRRVDISRVVMIAVDQPGTFNDLNQAERFLSSGEPQRAIARYRRFHRASSRFWSDVVASRLVVAADRADQIDAAATSYVRVVRSASNGPARAVAILPQRLPVRKTGRMIRAMEQLDAGLAMAVPSLPDTVDECLAFRLFRFALLRRAKDGRAAQAAVELARMPPRPLLASERAGTAFLDAVEACTPADVAAAETGLETAILQVAESLLPRALLQKGKLLVGRAAVPDDYVRASWPFLRIPIHFPGDPLAASGWCGAAGALEMAGLRPQAVTLLGKCLADPSATAELQALATDSLERLQAEPAAPR